jgi:hypothetical protein
MMHDAEYWQRVEWRYAVAYKRWSTIATSNSPEAARAWFWLDAWRRLAWSRRGF